MMLRDVLTIPEKVDASDYVLQLVQGVEAADRTLADYVVTDSLAAAFDDALSLVQRTLEGGTSKGAFIHGSFGSGKSHFMAVLHLLLTGNTKARALPGLQHVVARRRAVLDTRLLAVDYHLLGAKSFEQALFSGYLATVQRLHPDAPLPVLHRSDGLLADAAAVRARMGDEAFFASLNEGAGVPSGWGKRAAAWTAETYAAAAAAPVGDRERDRLVTALIATHFQSYRHSGEWLGMEDGLRAMTEHARGLGYDGVVLFLDELVLWLAQHLSDSTFISTETSKVAKLVETGMSALPVPLVSFVARQRDLKDFLGGDTRTGAEQVATSQSFIWWEDRFERIELQAADLPEIVNRRLLTPKNEEGRQALRAAVDRVKSNATAWGYLLTDEHRSSGTDFELVYPFSPALVDAMIALSSLMQRERTALYLMGELLSDGRDELTVEDVIPAGDLFDVAVLRGKPPLTAEMRAHFEHARTFYERRFRPYLLAKHNLTEEEATALPRTHAFRTEDRLAKTLLLAALASGAVSLRNLTAAKLAALNYGTIRTYVPGQEASRVLTLVTEWAVKFPEIHIGEGADPVISVVLSGISADVLLEQVQHEDTDGNRRSLLRTLLSEELGISARSGLLAEYTTTVVWRGTKREVDVIFGNVRDTTELPDDALRATPGRWKVVIDFPFDAGQYSPQDDVNRISRLRENGVESTTLAWIPHFFTDERMRDVGRLHLLTYLLTGDRFDTYAQTLNPNDRAPMRAALEGQRRTLRDRVLGVLRQAYGATPPVAADVETQIHASQVFSTLQAGLAIQPPVAPSLRAALESAVRQALDFQHPDHPRFTPEDTEVRRSDLATVLDVVRQAVDAGGRVEGLERSRAKLLERVARPLRCGEVRETVYALAPESFGWLSDFTRWVANAPTHPEVRVAELRTRLAPWGMPSDVEDLLILTWSAFEDREWTRAETRIAAPAIGGLTSDMVLRPARLPDQEDWQRATRAAEALFGAPRQPRRSAAGVARLARAVRDAVARLREPANHLMSALDTHAGTLGLSDGSPRLVTARRTATLLDELGRETDDTVLLTVLAGFDLPAEPQALAYSMTHARDLAAGLDRVEWDLLTSASRLPDGRGDQILAELRAVAVEEELHAPLLPVVRAAEAKVRDAFLAITRPADDRGATPTAPPVPESPTPSMPGADEARGSAQTVTDVDEIELDIADAEASLNRVVEEIRAALRKKRGSRLTVWWRIE